MKYKIEKFESPIMKSYKNLDKFDVARFEFGDYDNWVNAIVLNVRLETKNYSANPEKPNYVSHIVLDFATQDGREETCYSSLTNNDCIFEVIGKAKALEEKLDKDNQPNL